MRTQLQIRQQPEEEPSGFASDEPTPVQAAAVQVLLAEKRTALSVMRFGLAVAVVPLSLATVLVALSRWYSWVDNLHFLVPIFTVSLGLVALAAYLIVGSLGRIRHYDRMIAKFRANSLLFAELIE